MNRHEKSTRDDVEALRLTSLRAGEDSDSGVFRHWDGSFKSGIISTQVWAADVRESGGIADTDMAPRFVRVLILAISF
jgi:hypothetical protein